MERINLKQMFCTETQNFWTLMYVILAITILILLSGMIYSLQVGQFFYFFYIGIAGGIYVMQAFYFRQLVEAYEKAFTMGAPLIGGHPG